MASASLKATTLGKQAKTDLPAAVFGEDFHESLVHEAARADLAARRRGTASTPRPRRGLDDHRQGLEAEGHRPRPRRRAQRPAPPRRWRRVRAEAALAHLQGQSQGPPPGAALGVLGARRPRQRSRCSTPRAFEAPSTKQAAEALGKWGAEGADAGRSATPRRPACVKSFRNIPKVDVLPVGSAGVVDVIGHASLIVTQSGARDARGPGGRGRASSEERRGGRMDARAR